MSNLHKFDCKIQQMNQYLEKWKSYACGKLGIRNLENSLPVNIGMFGK